MQGIVLYADGGVRPVNPGYAGSGIHGYLYDTATIVRGIGLGSSVATTKGYFPKTEAVELDINKFKSKTTKKDKNETEEQPVLSEDELKTKCKKENICVMPSFYVDMVFPIDNVATNNLAELNAVIRAVDYTIQLKLSDSEKYKDLEYLVINTDSELTVKGKTEWLPNWIRNQFRKNDGTQIANHHWWEALSKLLDKAKQIGITIDLRWVRGHNGEFGNEKADMMATLAVYKAYRREYGSTVSKSPIEAYWKLDNELHPFIQHKYMYFNSGSGYHQPGIYNLGNHGKDDDLLGTRQSDGSYSHIRLGQIETILEQTIQFACNTCNSSDNIWVGYVGRLSLPTTREAVAVNGMDCFDPMSKPHVGYRGIGSGKDPLVRMLRPPHLANRAITEVTTLSNILDEFVSGSQRLVVTDITSKIYDVTVSTNSKGVETKEIIINKNLPVGMPSIKVDVEYKLIGSETVEKTEVILSAGIDILTRNSLKRIEKLNPCVYVVTWSEGPQTFRYATIVKTDDAIGIWGGVYSNLFVVPPKKEKQKKA